MYAQYPVPKKETIVKITLKEYKNYVLCAMINKENLEKYKKTSDESLLLYKFCENGKRNIPDYSILLNKEKTSKNKSKYA